MLRLEEDALRSSGHMGQADWIQLSTSRGGRVWARKHLHHRALCSVLWLRVGAPGLGTASPVAGGGTRWAQWQNEELGLGRSSCSPIAAAAAAATVCCWAGSGSAAGGCVCREMAEQGWRCSPTSARFLALWPEVVQTHHSFVSISISVALMNRSWKLMCLYGWRPAGSFLLEKSTLK